MMPSCFKEIHRVARSQHKCCECGGTIKPLEAYQYVSGVWDGGPASFKTCTWCVEARGFYVDHFKDFRDPEDGACSIGDLRTDLDYAASDFCLPGDGLGFKALRYVAEMNRRRAAAKGGAA